MDQFERMIVFMVNFFVQKHLNSLISTEKDYEQPPVPFSFRNIKLNTIFVY